MSQVAMSDGSRPSSTDGKKRDNQRRGNQPVRGQGNNRRGTGRQPSQGGRQQSGDQATPSSESPATVTSPLAQEPAGQRIMERAITDIKPMPSAQAASQQQNPAPAAPQQALSAQGSTLGLNAPVFQPGASVYPTPGAPTDLPPRHRKSASTGSHSSPGSFASPSFASPLQNFSPNLHSMREDVAEEGEIDEASAQYQAQQFQQQGAQPSVGAFSAPRFAALAHQQQQAQAGQQESEVLGPSGRPQLAPTFQFGARRRTATGGPAGGPAITEDDLGFQFPQQQHYQPESQNPSSQQPQAHRRTGSEVSGMLAEQVCASLLTCIGTGLIYGSLDCLASSNRSTSGAAATAFAAANRNWWCHVHFCRFGQPWCRATDAKPSPHSKPAGACRGRHEQLWGYAGWTYG